MKSQLNLWPAWLKVLVYFLVLWLATLVAGTVAILNDFLFFLLISLVISWIFIHAEGGSIRSLGFMPCNKKDYSEFFSGLATGGLMLMATVLITLLLTQDPWSFNSHIDPVYVAIAFFTCLWSALIQEFVFRGYPFQTLLQHYGPLAAQIFIAIPFGLMHLDHNMDLSTMVSVMLTTGLGSVLFGLAYQRTGKLFLPVGLHLGWNYAQQLIPRTAGGDHSGIIIIAGEHVGYAWELIIGPYLFVVILVIAYFLFATRRQHVST